MIDHMLYLTLIILVSVSFSKFLELCFGYPGKEFTSDIDAGAIFFGWSYHLAYMRVEIVHGEQWIRDLNARVLAEFTHPADVLTAKRDFKRAIFMEGRQFFTWERAFGMCIYCTNFWVSSIACLFFTSVNPLQSSLPPYFLFFTIPFLSLLILKHVNTSAN